MMKAMLDSTKTLVTGVKTTGVITAHGVVMPNLFGSEQQPGF